MKTNREHKLLDSFQLRGTPGKLPNKETAFILLLNLGGEKKKRLRTNILEPKTVEYTKKNQEKKEGKNGNLEKSRLI